jgi:RNA ligase (TIGR02306 family)
MASSIVVPVVQLKNIRPHTNADKLEIVDVLGYQMCVPKGKYKSGDIGVYFPADCLIPDEWSTKLGVKPFLKGKDNNRVGRIRLRGEPSFGIVANLPSDVNWNVGDDVHEFYGVEKYEPPIRVDQADIESYDSRIDPYFQKYTDIENGRIFTDIFEDGEEIVITEKVHGTNCKIGIISGNKVAGSMNHRRKPSEDNTKNIYWFPWTIPGMSEAVTALNGDYENIQIFGEVYGSSIQKGFDYGAGQQLGFRGFDILCDGRYFAYDKMVEHFDAFGIPIVPELYRGPFNMDVVKEIADGNTTFEGATHIREGVVVKPVVERLHPKIGRVVLKYIGTEYELTKKRDYKDV